MSAMYGGAVRRVSRQNIELVTIYMEMEDNNPKNNLYKERFYAEGTGLAVKRATGVIRQKSVSTPCTIPGKLTNCSSKKSGRVDLSGEAAKRGHDRRLQKKRTHERLWSDGAVSTASRVTLENTCDSSFEKKRQKLMSSVPSSHPSLSSRQTTNASNPPNSKDVRDKTLKDGSLGSKKTRPVIPIGPGFQAEIPVWIAPTKEGKFYGSPGDSNTLKWLGTGVWPTYSLKKEVHYKKVGEGRPGSCSCALARSTKCIKQHIQEARKLLEKELKRAFYTWKFDQMGEECGTKSWTDNEEQKFKALVKNNPLSSTKGFWEIASIAFPRKSEKDLLSYYYNVFLINRMRLLATSSDDDHIDSDDDHYDDFFSG